MKTKTVAVPRFPSDLWKQLKIRAAAEDQTLQLTLAKAITEYLEKSA